MNRASLRPAAFHPATLVGWSLFAAATIVTLIAVGAGASVGDILRDPAASFDVPLHAGLLSWPGIAILTATAAITALAASLVSRHRWLLVTASVLSFVLAVDDRFMLHETVGPELLGVPELAFYGFYGFLALVVALGLWRAGVELRGLKIALAFLTVSVLTDVFKVHGPFSFWLEDFTKLAGFGAWLTFWWGLARAEIRAAAWPPDRAGSPQSAI